MSHSIAVGQIWRENTLRGPFRYIRIEAVPHGTWVDIRTVVPAGDKWHVKPHSRYTQASAYRFDGRRGGYIFHADPVS